MKCFDSETHIWYPTHEWRRGLCQRCGKKQPGISDEARQEMVDQHHSGPVEAAGPMERMKMTQQEIDNLCVGDRVQMVRGATVRDGRVQRGYIAWDTAPGYPSNSVTRISDARDAADFLFIRLTERHGQNFRDDLEIAADEFAPHDFGDSY